MLMLYIKTDELFNFMTNLGY